MTHEIEHIARIKGLTEEQFSALYNISDILSSATQKDSLIEDALDLVISMLDAERGLFAKYDKDKQEFSIISARHIKKESISDLSKFSSGLLREVVAQKKPLLYHDAQGDPQLSQYESIHIQSITSVIGVPVFYEDELWGVIVADSQMKRKEFTSQNLVMLDFFSNLLSMSLDRISRIERLQDENRFLRNQLEATAAIPDIIGESKPMKQLARLIHKVAQTDATVLITGESGTGKDLVAQALHKLSPRKEYSFIAQFCGAIPDNLLESELFGYKKGAFTGANSDKKGLLEIANKGTFFLDEIADISPALQAKLLRVLENKEIIRLGDTKVNKIDIRIVAATNKDLQMLAKDGEFREDLLYRLNVFPIRVPSLRERLGDIPLLTKHFIKQFGTEKVAISKEAIKKLEHYSFPGNVRQLINIVQRALIYCDDGEIQAEHIILEDAEITPDFQGTLKEFELLLLKKRLDQLDGNRTLAAESLGVSRRWVQMKLKEIEESEDG